MSKVNDNRNYERFRRETRSSADTYSRLYLKENERPRYGKVTRIKNASQLRSLLDKDKSTYYDSAHEPVRRVQYIGADEEYAGGWFAQEAERDAGNGKLIRICARAIIAAALVVVCFGSLVMTMGFKALAESEIAGDLRVYYDEFSAFAPGGASPAEEKAEVLPEEDISESDISGTDLSGSDISATDTPAHDTPDEQSASDLSQTDIIAFASECDIRVINAEKLSREKELATTFKAGIDALSSAGMELELYRKVEAGIEYFPASEFAKNRNADISYVVEPTREQLDTVGCHTLRVKAGDKERNVLLIVEDTVAPVVSVTDIEMWLGNTVRPEDFIAEAKEVTPIVVNYLASEPNLTMAGEQVVYLEVSDLSGNKCEMQTALLTILVDTEPPVISGAKDQTITIGDSVSYKKGVTATDNCDGEVKVEVDSSAVNPKKAGTYEVVYTARDKAGNVATKTVKFKFKEKVVVLSTEEQLEKYVNSVAGKIFKSGMSKGQKAKAIYNWCRANIGYSGHSDKSSWKKAAVAGFKNRSGDCYTYFACAKALFEYCGITNIDVIKVRNSSSESRHYWSLINVGSGYYHFDATPRKGGFNGFMRTDAQLKKYSDEHKNSHRFDSSKYPATPTSSYGS